jgi:hypothetical protein
MRGSLNLPRDHCECASATIGPREQESLTINFGAGLWHSKLLQAGGVSRKNAMPLRLRIKFETSLGGDIYLLAQLFI